MSKDRWSDGKLVECEFGFCETCGRPKRAPNAKLCDGCWSIEAHLESYLRDGGDKARRFVADALEKAKEEAIRAKLIEAVSYCRLDEEDMHMDNDSPHRHNGAIDEALRAMRDLDLTP